MPEARDTLLRLLRSPRLTRLLEDPRSRAALVRGLRLRARLGATFDGQIEALASRLNLATQREMREIKRSIRRLERELQASRAGQAERAEDFEERE